MTPARSAPSEGSIWAKRKGNYNTPDVAPMLPQLKPKSGPWSFTQKENPDAERINSPLSP